MTKPKIKPIKIWRSNYLIYFLDSQSALRYDNALSMLLIHLARICEIDCKIQHDYEGGYEQGDNPRKTQSIPYTNLVYFRSTKHSKISGREFRKLVDTIIHSTPYVNLIYGIDCGWQYQSKIHLYPFPD